MKRVLGGIKNETGGKPGQLSKIFVVLVLVFTGFVNCGSCDLLAAEKEKIAVTRFEIEGARQIRGLDVRLQQKLAERLTEMGFEVADTLVVNKYISLGASLEKLRELGSALGVSWVVRGTATQIGKKISLDIGIVDVTGRKGISYMYVVAENMSEVDQAITQLAKSIRNKISGYIQVAEVKVKGNKRIESDAILAVVKTRKGDALDYDQLDKDLRAVYKMGFFKDVIIETEDSSSGKVVVFHVAEKPSIGRIVFEGNKHVDKDDLKKEIGISLYSIYNPYEVKQSVNRLKEYYRQKGYYSVDVESEVEPLPGNEVMVKYRIQENEKVYIKKIKFNGNKRFSDGDLKDLMTVKEKGFFSWLSKSGVLDKKKLDFDIQKINAFYHNHGFVKAKVGEPLIQYQKGKGLYITIDVYEGPQYKVGEVSIKGDVLKNKEELLKQIMITKEEFFNRETVRRDILRLKGIYKDAGYAYVELTPRIKENDKKHTVDVTYAISKGPKVVFERINIAGNTVTRDKVIRRELKVAEGDYFNGSALRKSMWNLNRLGYFSDVDIQPRKGSRNDTMVLDISVKEKPTGSFSFGVGYSSVDKLMVMAQIAESNFLGRGQKISVSANLGAVSNEFDIRFREPWLFDRPISGEINVYKWKREYDEYTKDSVGGELGVGFPLPLDDFTRGYITYDLDLANIKDVADTAALEIKDMEGRNMTSSLTFEVRRDNRNRFWNTSKGSINSLSFEYAGGLLGGDVAFNKYLARSGWYFPLWWDTVFMAQGRWGYVTKRSGGKLPVYQKFRIGGLNTVRGFDYSSISPRDPTTGDRIGGEKMMIYNLEYRFPLVKEAGIMGLFFMDMGNVFEKDESWTFSGIKKSVGTGIRWYSPLGPLRLEYGKVLGPKEDEPSGNWEFSIGGVF